MKNITVAVIEDDSITLELITQGLEQQLSATVYAFSRSKAAREFLLKQTAGTLDVVISDQRMPEYDGLSLLQACRSAHINIPFILLTADTTRETVMRAKELGATHFLAKPFVVEDVVNKVVAIAAKGE
ncbi:response regulator [Alteromonas pelagimontana]|uniref:Response regulator n=1 Tax=Alteromonas pelagimontana TaxID=1858656 RepID=A0A6M4MAR2_9ALTE|nr:response regulator [Alteromonas pelagimontana]QJR80127.1 response regulator [Alteromonas pelagimontana]